MVINFDTFIKDKPVKKTTYLAVLTRDPDEAIAAYVKKTGFIPTALLIRPDFIPTKDNPLFIRSRHAAWGLILVSHMVAPSEIVDDTDLTAVYRDREAGDIDYMTNMKDIDSLSIPAKKNGRPAAPKAICPHCHGKITDFESLGYWYGWSFGISPPYWEELRLYVFHRDGYQCQTCNKKFPGAFLQAHHINPKENGGEDGARNLQTLCQGCHQDRKPIFPEEI